MNYYKIYWRCDSTVEVVSEPLLHDILMDPMDALNAIESHGSFENDEVVIKKYTRPEDKTLPGQETLFQEGK